MFCFPSTWSVLKLALGLFCLLLFTSCGNRSADTALLSSLDQTLTQSTLETNRQLQFSLLSLQEKLNQPCSRDRAAQWLPVARRAEWLTLELSDYILRQKQALTNAHGNVQPEPHLSDTLQTMVKNYRTEILRLHEHVNKEFAVFFEGLEETGGKQAAISTQLQLLKQVDDSRLPVALAQLQLTIMQTGAKVIAFCGEHVGCITESFETYAAIIGQSSNGLLPGQALEITAGMGGFSRAAQPKITIDGKLCEVGDDGAVRYSLTVSRKPGTYRVPVLIQYVDEEGAKQWIKKDVEYEVLGKE